jgi:hypothetical protein
MNKLIFKQKKFILFISIFFVCLCSTFLITFAILTISKNSSNALTIGSVGTNFTSSEITINGINNENTSSVNSSFSKSTSSKNFYVRAKILFYSNGDNSTYENNIASYYNNNDSNSIYSVLSPSSTDSSLSWIKGNNNYYYLNQNSSLFLITDNTSYNFVSSINNIQYTSLTQDEINTIFGTDESSSEIKNVLSTKTDGTSLTYSEALNQTRIRYKVIIQCLPFTSLTSSYEVDFDSYNK